MGFSFLQRIIKARPDFKLILSMIVGFVIVLSVSHHWLRFWELPVSHQLITLLVAWPILTLCMWFLASRLWQVGAKISRKRWLVFLLPALVFASGMAVYLFSPPVVWHQLEIIPSGGPVQLLEIKIPGMNVRFSELGYPAGWQLRDQVLVTNTQTPASIHYSFLSAVDKPVVFTFLSSPEDANVTVIVDNEKLQSSLVDTESGQKQLQVSTGYRFGVSGVFIRILIILIDLIAFTLLLTLLWLAQEISPLSQNTGLFFNHKKGLLVLVLLACILHTINFLAVPLVSGPDTHGYLDGAAYWIQYHTLDGIPILRGPGPTVLFLPVLMLFERNPLGMKLLLHLLAIACVPLAYRLGWQISKRPSLAFGAGLIAVLTPDLMFYSSYVMSDLPNIFFGLLFCTLLFSALETFSWKWLLAVMLTGSFAVLFRSENMAQLGIGILALLAKLIWEWKMQAVPIAPRLRRVGVVAFLAFVPILAWVGRNYTMHGFLGMTAYEPAFYDGWVYYGEGSHISITDADSPAVGTIRTMVKTYSHEIPEYHDIPTGMDIYGVLGRHGYADREAFSLLRQATWDSILNNPALTLQVLEIKIRKGLQPETLPFQHTFPLPGDEVSVKPTSSEYFDADHTSFGPAITLQRWADDWMEKWYQYVYPGWIWFCVGMLLLCCYRRPFLVFVPLAAITLARIFIPTMIAIAFWRYAMAGIILLQLFGLIGLWSLVHFAVFLYRGAFRSSVS